MNPQSNPRAGQAHTAGPWGYDLNHTVGRHENGEWLESVCQLPLGTHKRRPTAQERADMRLIAAAPELLALVRALVEGGGIMEPSTLFDEAKRLVAKAEGRA